MIEFCGLTAGYEATPILQDICFRVPRGSITAIIGPNGSGKTTLLRAAARQIRVQNGSILLQGKDIRHFERKEFARTAAFLPQVRTVPAITVQRLVAHGRFPYLGFSRTMRPQDREAVEEAMQLTGVTDWALRDLRALSGGERQRVYLAMLLAQGTDLLFLDEPGTYLDLQHQFALLELLSELNAAGKTIVMVLHDLAQAIRYSQHIALLEAGHLVAFRPATDLAESGEMDRVFRVQLHRSGSHYFFTPQECKGE